MAAMGQKIVEEEYLVFPAAKQKSHKYHGWSTYLPPRTKGLLAGLIKGNQWFQ